VNAPRKATPEMVEAVNPPQGFEPILSNSAFGWENGPIFERNEGGVITRGFRVAERHINAGGMCHGGMMMTFADILLATGVMQAAPPPFVTIRLTTDFIDAVKLGEWVEGTAKPGAISDGVVAVSAVIEAEGRVVANASALFKLLGRGMRAKQLV
jgi:uncharacterized protein (TIGR00369 family)